MLQAGWEELQVQRANVGKVGGVEGEKEIQAAVEEGAEDPGEFRLARGEEG